MKTTGTNETSQHYIESSLPIGVTMSEYRRSRPQRQSRWERLKQLAGGSQVVAAVSV